MRAVKAFARVLPEIVRALARVVGDPALPRGVKIAVTAAFVYLLSPLDVLPDLVPFVGYLDDVLLGAVVVDGIFSSVDRALILRYWPGSPAALNAIARISRLLSAWVPRRLRDRVFSFGR